MTCFLCYLRMRYTGRIKKGVFGYKAEYSCPNGHIGFKRGNARSR